MGNYITTYTRKHFDPINPDAELICIEDIAHALPMICRGNGHVSSFWSVGEHCILCAKEAAAKGYSNRLVLAALLHDASECYMSDVPRPLKQNMKKFLGFTLNIDEEKLIKEIDNALLWYDLKYLLDEESEEKQPKLHVKVDYTVRSFSEVEKEYLGLFEKYREV